MRFTPRDLWFVLFGGAISIAVNSASRHEWGGAAFYSVVAAVCLVSVYRSERKERQDKP